MSYIKTKSPYIIFFIFIVLFSCNKNDEPHGNLKPFKSMCLTSMSIYAGTNPDDVVFVYGYNDFKYLRGNIISSFKEFYEVYKSFEYNKDRITVTIEEGLTKRICYCDLKDNLIINYEDKIKFEYEGNKLKYEINPYYENSEYIWDNDNLVQKIYKDENGQVSRICNFEYTDYPRYDICLPMEWYSVSNFLNFCPVPFLGSFGYFGKVPKYWVKSVTEKSQSSDEEYSNSYTYEFNEYGYPIKIINQLSNHEENEVMCIYVMNWEEK